MSILSSRADCALLISNMKMIRLFSFALVISILLPFSHGLLAKDKDKENDEETADSDSEVTIEKTVLAKETETGFDPVKSFAPSDTFAVLVFLSEPKVGTKVKAIWTIVNAGGMENKKILEKAVELTPEAIKEAKDAANRINFSLTHDNPYPAGDYKADIYLNGELAKTVEFKIK